MFESTQAPDLSVLPSLDGPLGVLYRRACNASTEWQAAGFWQAYLSRALDPQYFVTTAETPPDNARTRVDTIAWRYRPESDDLVPTLCTEVKKPEGKIKDAENQACNAGTRSMMHHKLTQMYAITTSGTRFRTWRLYW